jgi:hypothetical protein
MCKDNMLECEDCGMLDDSLTEDARGLAVCPWCYVADEDMEEDDVTIP